MPYDFLVDESKKTKGVKKKAKLYMSLIGRS
jgi:hypothetical protein